MSIKINIQLKDLLEHIAKIPIDLPAASLCQGILTRLYPSIIQQLNHSECQNFSISSIQPFLGVAEAGKGLDQIVLKPAEILRWDQFTQETPCVRGQLHTLLKWKLDEFAFDPRYIHPKLFTNLVSAYKLGYFFKIESNDCSLVDLTFIKSHCDFTNMILNKLSLSYSEKVDDPIEGLRTIIKVINVIHYNYKDYRSFQLDYSHKLPMIFGGIHPSQGCTLSHLDAPIIECSICSQYNVFSHAEKNAREYTHENLFPQKAPSTLQNLFDCQHDFDWSCGSCGANLAYVYNTSCLYSCNNCECCLKRRSRLPQLTKQETKC